MFWASSTTIADLLDLRTKKLLKSPVGRLEIDFEKPSIFISILMHLNPPQSYFLFPILRQFPNYESDQLCTLKNTIMANFFSLYECYVVAGMTLLRFLVVGLHLSEGS